MKPDDCREVFCLKRVVKIHFTAFPAIGIRRILQDVRHISESAIAGSFFLAGFSSLPGSGLCQMKLERRQHGSEENKVASAVFHAFIHFLAEFGRVSGSGHATKIIDPVLARKRLPDVPLKTGRTIKKARAEACALRNRRNRRLAEILESLDSKQFLQVVIKNDVLIKQAYQSGRWRGGACGCR